MTLCPSLSAFRFNPDTTLDLQILNPIDEEEDALLASQQQARLDALAIANNGAGADGGEGQGDISMGGEENDNFMFDDFGGGSPAPQHGGGGEADFFSNDPDLHRPNNEFDGNGNNEGGDELIISMDQRGASGAGMGMDLLELGALGGGKNWAGPEHWKMRRAVVGGKKGSFVLLLSRVVNCVCYAMSEKLTIR